jgi:hypothetical protein
VIKRVICYKSIFLVDNEIDEDKDTLRTILVYAAEGETVKNVAISGLQINANASGQNSKTRISAIYIAEDGGTIDRVRVRDCIFRDCQHGVFARGNNIVVTNLKCYDAFDPIGGIAKGFSFQPPATNEETYYYGNNLYVNGADGAGINWTGIESSRKGNGVFKNITVENAFQVKSQGPWKLDLENVTIKNGTDKGLKLSDARSTTVNKLKIVNAANECLELDPIDELHTVKNVSITATSSNQPAVKLNGTCVIENWYINQTASDQRSILAQGAHVAANKILIDGGTLNYPLRSDSSGQYGLT